MEPPAIEAARRHREPAVVHRRDHVVTRDQLELVAFGDAHHARGEDLLEPAPPGFPRRDHVELLHDEAAAGLERLAGRVHPVDRTLATEQVEHVDLHDRVPARVGPPAGCDALELHPGVDVRGVGGAARHRELLVVDVDTGDASLGRLRREVEAEEPVTAAGVEDLAVARHLVGHVSKRAGAPAQPRCGPGCRSTRTHRRARAIVAASLT